MLADCPGVIPTFCNAASTELTNCWDLAEFSASNAPSWLSEAARNTTSATTDPKMTTMSDSTAAHVGHPLPWSHVLIG